VEAAGTAPASEPQSVEISEPSLAGQPHATHSRNDEPGPKPCPLCEHVKSIPDKESCQDGIDRAQMVMLKTWSMSTHQDIRSMITLAMGKSRSCISNHYRSKLAHGQLDNLARSSESAAAVKAVIAEVRGDMAANGAARKHSDYEVMPVSRTPFAAASGLNEKRLTDWFDKTYDPAFDGLDYTFGHWIASYLHNYTPPEPTLPTQPFDDFIWSQYTGHPNHPRRLTR
jgi:hypothetical protein